VHLQKIGHRWRCLYSAASTLLLSGAAWQRLASKLRLAACFSDGEVLEPVRSMTEVRSVEVIGCTTGLNDS
jgi:hypothetical protein